MRVLLVEDDELVGEGLQMGLSSEGYAIDWVRDGESAKLALLSVEYDLMLLDLGLPRCDGLQVLTMLRNRKTSLPVLILSARDSIPDRVKGLDYGADDYMSKPFDLDELKARLRALMRRTHLYFV